MAINCVSKLMYFEVIHQGPLDLIQVTFVKMKLVCCSGYTM